MVEEKGEEEVVGVLVGKNQTGPNYRNHNESVSRGTLLPGKHQGICVHSGTHTTSTHTLTHTLKRMQKCTGAMHLHIFLLYSFEKTLTHTVACACATTCAQTHVVHRLLPNLVWILIISLARPV